MRFNTLLYPLFLGAVLLGVLLLPPRFRKHWLLLASYAFYASWHYPYVLLLLGSATFNHLGARWIVSSPERGRRGALIIAGNLLVLAAFKYLEWLAGVASDVLARAGFPVQMPVPHWVLPLGISFYTFESMSYIVDLVRRRQGLYSYLDYQLFVAFFPKLIAGPILRASELLPQITRELRPTSREFLEGTRLVVTGLFLKIVIADTIGENADTMFARAREELASSDVCLMAVTFGLQIYLDFSAYSRIAIGSSRIVGIALGDNFNHPYLATSPVDFWNRWHISLSRWIRDYLFVPLVGSRPSLPRMCRAALIALALCGLWHGAGWSFVLWGVYHGALIAGYHVLRRVAEGVRGKDRGRASALGRVLGRAVTFALVSLGWLLFRSRDASEGVHLLERALSGGGEVTAFHISLYATSAALLAAVWLAPLVGRALASLSARLETEGVFSVRIAFGALEGIGLGLLVLLSVVYLKGATAFVYFQF